MRKYERPQMKDFGQKEILEQQKGAETEEKKPKKELPIIRPDIESDEYEKFEIGMFEAKMVKIAPGKEVELSTEDLTTCTAVAVIVVDGQDHSRYGLLSHAPYYQGPFYDQEFLSAEMERYEGIKNASAEKRAFIFVPMSLNNSLEIESITKQLEQYGIEKDAIIVKKNYPPIGSDHYKEYAGKVKIVFEKNGKIWIQHMNENGSIEQIFVEK